jgi:CPA2 family monovalent cation:H+ antiporter-2
MFMPVFSQIAIAFFALAIFGFLAKITKSFKPPFYILAGILLGPVILGWTVEKDVFSIFGDIGLIFLLFYLGYEFSLNTLVKRKKTLGLAGLIDFIVNFSIAFFLAYLLELSWFYMIVFAGMIYMSSSSIITKSLIQLGAVKEKEGEVVMGIMIFEDLVMIIFLVFIQSIAGQNGFDFLNVSKDIGLALLFSFVLIFFGKKYAPLLDRLINQKSHELSHLSFIAFLFLGVFLGSLFGVSMALSAFLIGLVVSETKHKREMQEVVIKFRDIFGALFFFYFGMTFSFSSIEQSIWLLLLISMVAVISKLFSGYLMSLIGGCHKDGGLFIGIVNIPRGEFSLIIAGIVAAEKPEFTSIAVILILITSLITTLIFIILNKLCKDKEICLLSKQFMEHESES